MVELEDEDEGNEFESIKAMPAPMQERREFK